MTVAYDRGFRDFKNNWHTNPYQRGSKHYAEWERGYEDAEGKSLDIVYQNGKYWVYKHHSQYTVYVDGLTHATADSSYTRDDDGLSLAKYRCDYLAKMAAKK